MAYTEINGLSTYTAASALYRLPLIHAGKPTGGIKCTRRIMKEVVICNADYVTSSLSPWKDALNRDIVRYLICLSNMFEIWHDW